MLTIDPGFISFLADFDINRLQDSADIIYIIDADFRLRGYNTSWEIFARKNNGQNVLTKFTLGTDITEALHGRLKEYYSQLYQKVLSTGERMDHEYECSSDKSYRKYRQSLYPLKHKAGIIISNHLLIEKPIDADPVKFNACHSGKSGVIIMCSHCRRTKDQNHRDKWDWIAEFVKEMPANLSHGLCNQCIAFYYPGFLEMPEDSN